MAESRRGKLTPRVIKRKLSDSVSVSSGSGRGSSRSRSSGGGGKSSSSGGGVTSTILKQKQAHDQKAFREQQIKRQQQAAKAYARQQREQEKARQAGKKVPKVTTGVFTKGGATVQETRGDFGSLVKLNKQRPGSVLVQEADGTYVLVEARNGINLSKPSTFKKFNENLELQGAGLFYPIGTPNKEGGIDYSRRVADSVGTSGDIGGLIESETKSRPAQPREIAEMITEGKIDPQFIGPQSVQVQAQQKIAGSQQNVSRQELPAVYVDSSGKPIVTITGKSKGAEFEIYKDAKVKKEKGIQATVLTPVEPEKKESKPEDFITGFVSGATNLANVILQPKPIFGDISGGKVGIKPKTTDEAKEKINKIIPPKPSLLGSTIDQAIKGEPLTGTGEGIYYDIGSAAFDAATIFAPIKKVPIPKISGKGTKTLPKGTRTLPKNSRFRDTFDDDTALYGFEIQRYKLGQAAVKPKITSEPKKVTPVQIDPDYQVSRLPVSKFPSELPEGVLAGFKETRTPLGKAAVNIPKPKVTKNTVSLGEGKGIRPGRDFTEQKIGLGKAGVKAEKPLDKRLPREKLVKIDPNYRVPRLPVSHFPIPKGESTLDKVRVDMGTGQGLKIRKTDKTPRFRKPQRIIKPPSKEDEIRISKGLILLTKQKEIKSTKISLGTSEKIIQKTDGKTVQNTLLKSKKKPSPQSFLVPKTSTIVIQDETMAYPPDTRSRQIIRTITTTKPQEKIIQRERPVTAITQKTIPTAKVKPLQKQRTKLASPLRPKQPARQRLAPIQKQPPIQKQIVEEIPPRPPIQKIAVIYNPRPRRKEKRIPKTEERKKVDFLGSTNIETVEGFRTKKTDISYGPKTGKLARKNILKTRSRTKVKIF